MARLERCWINAPSSHDEEHKLSGQLVLVDLDDTTFPSSYLVFFVNNGNVTSGYVLKKFMSRGWPDHLKKRHLREENAAEKIPSLFDQLIPRYRRDDFVDNFDMEAIELVRKKFYEERHKFSMLNRVEFASGAKNRLIFRVWGRRYGGDPTLSFMVFVTPCWQEKFKMEFVPAHDDGLTIWQIPETSRRDYARDFRMFLNSDKTPGA